MAVSTIQEAAAAALTEVIRPRAAITEAKPEVAVGVATTAEEEVAVAPVAAAPQVVALTVAGVVEAAELPAAAVVVVVQ